MADSTNGVTRFGEEWFTQEQIDEKRNDSLQLSRINKNGKLGEMIDIINSNFREIAMHGGGPAGVDGTSGLDGENGLNVEYIYALSDEMKAGVNYPVGEDSLDNLFTRVKNSGSSEHGSTVWYDTAQPISKEHKNEYVLRRYERVQDSSDDSEGKWTYDPNPVLWSHWGESGQDGNGVEYIYLQRERKLSEADEDRSLLKREHMDDSQKVIFDIDGFLPRIEWFDEEGNKELVTGRLEAYGLVLDESRWSSGYGMIVEGYDWTDSPVGTGEERRYEYVSIRKSSTDENDRKIWGNFEKPVLWSSYSSSKFTAFAFTVSESGVNLGNTAPSGGNYENPVPGPMTYDGKTYEWTDIIGTGSSGDNSVVWMTSSVMKDDYGYEPVWSRPVRITVEGGTDIIVRTDDESIGAGVTDPVSGGVIYEALEGKAQSSHTHTMSDITDWSGGGSGTVTVDPELNDTSSNPVQNKVIYEALSGKQDKLTPGQNITIDENNVISASGGGGSVVVDSELSIGSVNPVQNKVIATALNAKADTSSVPTKTSDLMNDSGFITSAEVPSGSSNFIGTFASINDLPQNASDGNYAYVGTSAPYSIYSYDSSRTPKWNATGATADTNTLTADEEDITASETGVLSLKNREDTTYSSKAYVRVRKNLRQVYAKKTYAYNEVTWVHKVEDIARTPSDKTYAYDAENNPDGYNSENQYFVGNPAPYVASSGTDAGNQNGHDQYSTLPIDGTKTGFPFAGKKSVRRSVPCITLNTHDNVVYFKWQYYIGNWKYNDIYYNEWYESKDYNAWGEAKTPNTPALDFSIDTVNHTPKTFACVEYGKTHYYHWDGYTWTRDETEQQESIVNTLPDGTFGTENTIYDIMYDVDLLGATIKPAKGVVIRYSGGKIKNGIIDFSSATTDSPIIIDCPDVQFFENVTIIKSWSQVMKDVWFDDIWLAMSNPTESSKFACTAISLSKNHRINYKHGLISAIDRPSRKLTIYGNGNKVTLDNSYNYSRKLLFSCGAIALYDLNIELSNTDVQTYDALFDVAVVLMRNVSYKGYSRIAANWGNPQYSISALELYDCDLRSTAFLFEGQFNKVRFYNSKLRYINPTVRQLYELISIGGSALNTPVENCNVEAYDTYIGGVWEIASGTGLDANGNILPNTQDDSWVSVYTYSYMKFHNCELVRFATDNGSEKRGNTNVTYEDCHFKICNMPWRGSCISTVTYKNCWIDIFSDKVGTNIGAFNFWNIKSARFEGCTFRNTSFTDPEVAMKDGTYYPQGYTYPPMRSNPIISMVPPRSVVGTATVDDDGNVALVSDWDFKLYMYGNRIIVNDESLEEIIDGSPRTMYPYSRFRILVVTPRNTSKMVILTDTQVRNLIVSKGNAFVHSIHGISGYLQANGSVGCSVYLNNRRNIIPVDNTVLVARTTNLADPGIDYSHANFRCCSTNFTFIDASEDIPRYGRYNAATGTVAWLTYSEEEDVINNV